MSRVRTPASNLPAETTVLGVLERNARTAVDRAGEVAERFAVRFAPRGRTGKLAGSIEAKTRRTPTGARSTVTYDPREAFYGGMVEAGTVNFEGRVYLGRARLFAQDDADRLIEDGADDAGRDIARML